MKVKIFTEITGDINRRDLEDEINKFIQDKEIVDIKYQTDFIRGEGVLVTKFSVLIMYEEN